MGTLNMNKSQQDNTWEFEYENDEVCIVKMMIRWLWIESISWFWAKHEKVASQCIVPSNKRSDTDNLSHNFLILIE